MSEIMDAYAGLLKIAEAGQDYRWDQVFFPQDGDDPEVSAKVIGTGFDITRDIKLPDIQPGNTVDAVAALRILRLFDGQAPELFLRARLTWTTSDGSERSSYAKYQISPDAARQLAGPQPEIDTFEDVNLDNLSDSDLNASGLSRRLMAAFCESIFSAVPYKADWRQVYPGNFDDLRFDDIDEETAARAEAAQKYHTEAVKASGEAEPEMLCMLADTEMGQVYPEELIKLYSWVARQPEIAAVVR